MYTDSQNHALREYQQIGSRGAIEDASPHRLIQLMMDHALAQMNTARGHILREEIKMKGHAIGSAISVINGLQASLNHKEDERMSANFDALYAYMMRRLLEANLKNDAAIVDEIAGLMRELKEAWDAIADDAERFHAASSGQNAEQEDAGQSSS